MTGGGVTDRSPLPGSRAWYEAMTDDELKVSMSQLVPNSPDFEAAKRVLDDRALAKRERRSDRLVIAILVIAGIVALGAIVAQF
jgi:CHASE3 domain sensor protein